jgi:hypothetical protein
VARAVAVRLSTLPVVLQLNISSARGGLVPGGWLRQSSCHARGGNRQDPWTFPIKNHLICCVHSTNGCVSMNEMTVHVISIVDDDLQHYCTCTPPLLAY